MVQHNGNEDKHSLAPYEARGHLIYAEGRQIASCLGEYDRSSHAKRQANAAFIVACMNACEGIPTETLRPGLMRELLGAMQATVARLKGRKPDATLS